MSLLTTKEGIYTTLVTKFTHKFQGYEWYNRRISGIAASSGTRLGHPAAFLDCLERTKKGSAIKLHIFCHNPSYFEYQLMLVGA